MDRFLSTARVVLAVAMALWNAVCFVQCMVQPCDAATMPCHSHGPAKAHVCPPQHDLRVAATDLAGTSPALLAAGPVEANDPPAAWQLSSSDGPRRAASPFAFSRLPLRI